jgi:hypothetical protein
MPHIWLQLVQLYTCLVFGLHLWRCTGAGPQIEYQVWAGNEGKVCEDGVVKEDGFAHQDELV